MIVADEIDAELDPPILGAIIILCHAIVLAIATKQSPGLLLGTFLFFNGLCSVFMFLGIERIPRILRIGAALSVVMQVAIMAITGQALLFAPALVMVIAGILLLYQDSSVAWLKPILAVGIVSGLLITALSACAASGITLPGWWEGRYLFRDRDPPLPKDAATTSPDLPMYEQP